MKKLGLAIVGLAASVVLAQTPNNINLRGKVSKVNGMSFWLTTDSGESIEMTEKRGFKVYDSVATDLSRVKATSFVGVTTVNKADGKEHAIEIHIFPDELRGTGEGRHIMGTSTDTAPLGLMTNGTVSQNRMTNGAVVKAGGGILRVNFAGGLTEIVVPADVKVTEIKAASHTIAVGDAIVVTGRKASNESIAADRATLIHR